MEDWRVRHRPPLAEPQYTVLTLSGLIATLIVLPRESLSRGPIGSHVAAERGDFERSFIDFREAWYAFIYASGGMSLNGYALARDQSSSDCIAPEVPDSSGSRASAGSGWRKVIIEAAVSENAAATRRKSQSRFDIAVPVKSGYNYETDLSRSMTGR